MGTIWQGPVTDRSQADVDNREPKAFLNAGDLNRIEQNIEHLSDVLHSFRYDVSPLPAVLWGRGDIPESSDIGHIIEKATALIEAYYEPNGYAGLSGIPAKQLDFTDINNVEQALYLIKDLLDRDIHYNTWGDLEQYTYGGLDGYSWVQCLMYLGKPEFSGRLNA